MMTNVEQDKSSRIISDFSLFAVRFNIRQSSTNRTLYSAVVNIVGRFKTPKADLFRTAEEAARSWGAFADPAIPMGLDHHFYDRTFEPVSIEEIAQVDGVVVGDAKLLTDFRLKRNYD
jgi:hypothetical protein